MANWTVATGSNHNVLNWERAVWREAIKQTKFMNFAGTGPTSGIRIVEDLARGNNAAGDTVYTTLVMALTGYGVSGDNQLQGNEEALVAHRQTVTIDQLRNAIKSDGEVTNQRTFLNFQTEARLALGKWNADMFDKWSANQLAGISTGLASNNLAGMQTPTAPTTTSGDTRIIYGPGSATTEASLSTTSTSGFQLTMLDKAVNYAQKATPVIEPLTGPNGDKYYVAVLHPDQIYSVKTDATAARVTWYDYHTAVIQGGGKDIIGNAMMGSLGRYNNVIIHADSRIPLAPSTTRVRRAVFFGAQAATMAFGRVSGRPNRVRYIEQEEDFANRLGIGSQIMGGLKKNVYNSKDFATIVMSSYASV